MSKLVKILASIVGLALFFIFISSTFESCKSKNDDSDSIDLVSDELNEGDLLTEDFDEELFDEEDSSSDSSTSNDSFVEFEDEPFDDNSSTESSTTTSSDYTPSSSTSGDFMIISGSYLVESNADSMKKKLRSMGYNSAEIVRFDNSSYYTVIASRHSSYSQAVETTNNLKTRGIDCYVKRKS